MELARVSSKGQITIPIEIRKKLNLKEGKKEELIETIINLTTKKLNINSFSPELEKSLYNTELGTLKIIRDNLLNIESLEDLKKYLN